MARCQPLRRGSQRKGKCEKGFWRPLGPNPYKILDGFRRFQSSRREPGERFGPGGPFGERILRYLINVTGRSGRCDPSLTRIAEKVGCCVSAVVNALRELADLGFVTWLRRYAPAPEKTQWGPQVQQATNAYRVSLPPAAAALLNADAPPAPADFEAAKAAMAAELRAYENHDLNEIFERWRPRLDPA